MKKNILKLGLVTLLIIFFAIFMPNVTFAASIEKIEITVPEPVIGKTLTTDASKIHITDESGCNFIINKIEWYCDKLVYPGTHLNNYEKITDLNTTCNTTDKYQLQLEFLFPEDSYSYSSDETILMNGIKLNKGTDYILGESIIDNVNYQSTFITYNFEHAKPQKEISKIEITVPEPVIGEKLTTNASKIQVKDGEGESFVIDTIDWYCDKLVAPGTHLNNYEKITDLNKPCNNTDKYQILLDFLVPNKYVPSSNIVVTVNGTKINSQNLDELNWGAHGDTDNDGVVVAFKFGKAKEQKEISKIEITTPTPIAGEKLITDISKFEVKIDGTETLNITNVKWLSEDFKALSSDIAEAGKKYNVGIDFNIPNKYALSSDIIVTVNGEQINVDNIEEFNYASSGDLDFDYTHVNKLIEVKEATKENPKDEAKEEPKEESDEAGKETKNPKTGDTITKSFIIFIIAVAGIALTINSIKKQNK